ncbi:hypothetical protein D3C77_631350 [compost metagenome]
MPGSTRAIEGRVRGFMVQNPGHIEQVIVVSVTDQQHGRFRRSGHAVVDSFDIGCEPEQLERRRAAEKGVEHDRFITPAQQKPSHPEKLQLWLCQLVLVRQFDWAEFAQVLGTAGRHQHQHHQHPAHCTSSMVAFSAKASALLL